MKSTPGPWKIRNHWITDSTEIVTIGTIQVVTPLDATLNIDLEVGAPSNPANAHLIAAAPDLLEACKYALQELEEENFPHTKDALTKALTKAEGRKP
jgi:hypothetical protein